MDAGVTAIVVALAGSAGVVGKTMFDSLSLWATSRTAVAMAEKARLEAVDALGAVEALRAENESLRIELAELKTKEEGRVEQARRVHDLVNGVIDNLNEQLPPEARRTIWSATNIMGEKE